MSSPPIYAGATPEFRFGSEKPTEPVVLTVYERYEGESAVAAKTYTLSELKALAQTEVVGYQHWKNGSEKVIASNLYATVGSLLADAGVEFGAGDAVTAADPTDFTSTLTYEDSGVYKYYVNEDGATEVPAAILLSWNTGSGTPEDIAKTAYISGSLPLCLRHHRAAVRRPVCTGQAPCLQRGHADRHPSRARRPDRL